METITRRSLVAAAAGAVAVTALSACSSGAGSSSASAAVSSSASSSASGGTMDLHVFTRHETESPEWVAALPAAQDKVTTQLFIVAGMGLDKTTASISMHERGSDGKWTQVLSTPGFVGRDGMCPDADHKEGDFCHTPIGTYGFNKAFGIASDPGCKGFDYVQVDNDIYWSADDREGMHYNEMVNIKDLPDLDMENSEHIIEEEDCYQYCLNVSFNEEAVPGKGSAIFLHCFGPTKPYTGGCIAVPEYTMVQVLQRVQKDCVVVINTLEGMNAKL